MALKVKNIYKYLEAVARWLKLAKDERELLAKSSPVKHVESPRQLFIYMLTNYAIHHYHRVMVE